LHHYNACDEYFRFIHSGYIWLQATPLLTVPHCSQLQATTPTQKPCSWPNFIVAEVKFTLLTEYNVIFINYMSSDHTYSSLTHYQGIIRLTVVAWANCSDTMTAVCCSRYTTHSAKPDTMGLTMSTETPEGKGCHRQRCLSHAHCTCPCSHTILSGQGCAFACHTPMQTLPAFIVTCRGNR